MSGEKKRFLQYYLWDCLPLQFLKMAYSLPERVSKFTFLTSTLRIPTKVSMNLFSAINQKYSTMAIQKSLF